MAKRTYGQFCALARALDVVGERWTLLILRDLMLGPRRFSDILDGLPGLGTSLLTERLRHMETENLVRRSKLPPPAASTVYELTELGADLAPAILELASWGVRLLDRRAEGEVFNASWMGLYIQAAADKERAIGVRETYEFWIEDQVLHFRIDDGVVEAKEGRAPQRPDLLVRTDLKTFMDVGLGRLDPMVALAEGRTVVEGDADTMWRALHILRPPVVDQMRSAPATPAPATPAPATPAVV